MASKNDSLNQLLFICKCMMVRLLLTHPRNFIFKLHFCLQALLTFSLSYFLSPRQRSSASVVLPVSASLLQICLQTLYWKETRILPHQYPAGLLRGADHPSLPASSRLLLVSIIQQGPRLQHQQHCRVGFQPSRNQSYQSPHPQNLCHQGPHT